MIQEQDIPHLIALIDDDSEAVRAQVYREIKQLGRAGEQWILPYWGELSNAQQHILQTLFKESRWETFYQRWEDWWYIDDERLALEMALADLAFLDMGIYQPQLEDLLDKLYERFQHYGQIYSVDSLMQFLFVEEKYRAPGDNYYDPLNSNLIYVIQHKRGLQISLACLAILLAKRCQLPIYGLNVPGHFMILTESQREVTIRDPFRKGKIISRISKLMQPRDIRRAHAREIVVRVLRNIIYAYEYQQDQAQAVKYQRIYDHLLNRLDS